MLNDEEAVMLQIADFLDWFIDKHVSDDFKPTNSPIKQLIFHKLVDHIIIMQINIKNKF